MGVGVGDADEADAGGHWGRLVRWTAKEQDDSVEALDEILDRRREDAIGQGRRLETIGWWGEEKRHVRQRWQLVLQHC